MAFSPIILWQIDGETATDYFLGLQNHCRWWLKPWNLKMLYPCKKNYHKPRKHIQKQRHYFSNKIHLVKAMIFPVITYRCDSWTIKKTECWRSDAFELWCWRRLLRAPWTARSSKQPILKDASPEYSLKYWCWGWRFNTLATWCK